jgi:glycosyltransferase involved in cell wall biosynthesis
LAAADFYVASTPELAVLLQQSAAGYRGTDSLERRPAYVWRNVVDEEAVSMGQEADAMAKRSASGAPVIGYFSGSLAHEADFNVAVPGIVRILESKPDVRLLLVGHVEERKELKRFAHRTETKPFSDYADYLKAIARCDIVIIPLVSDPFNAHKSCVRWLDASVVGRPVIASGVGDYRNLIEHGVNGWLSPDDAWDVALLALLDDAALRNCIAANARRDALERFSTRNYWHELDPALTLILGGALEAADR